MPTANTYVWARIDMATKKRAANLEIRRVMTELESGKGKRLKSTRALLEDLNFD